MKLTKLSEFISEYGDGLHGTPSYSGNGEYYFINGNNLGDGCIVIDKSTPKISSDEYEKIKRPLTDRTVLLSINGSLGKTAFYRGEKIALGKSACFINIKETCSKEFFRYVLTTKEFQKYMLQVAHGSTIKNFAPSQVGEYEVFLPPKEDHLSIAELLSSIDSKINNNTAICSELESMAKLLYDYWFVQFDFPDENGKPYKSSGGKMVWNEELKREIPKGWEVKPLKEFITVIRGVSYKPTDERDARDADTVPLLKSNNIQNGVVNFDQPVFLSKQLVNTDQWLTKGSVFITMSSGSKAHMGKTAIIYKDLPYVFGAFCAKIIIDNSVNGYLSTYFRSNWFRVYIENVTLGTSINNIGNEQLTDICLPFPTTKVQKMFEGILQPLFKTIGELREENKQLASLRVFLLPMLMNGQVKCDANQ